ncbi:MAG: flotillin family protein, partial [Planctomycetota bacterium]
AISNIKFDKIVVWDQGANGGSGKGATANFLSNLAGSLPPMLNMMRDIGGVQMPEYFAKMVGEGDGKTAATSDRATAPPPPAKDEPKKKKE